MSRDRDPFRTHDPFRLQVFVPAIMSAGLLFSLLTLVRDVFAGRRGPGSHRRAAVAASAVVADVRRAVPSPGEQGLRPRRFYLLAAIGAGAAAAYVGPGALLNYAHDDGYVSDIAWLLGTSLLVAILAAGAAAVAATAWLRWPAPPAWARRAISTTPLAAAPGSPAADGGPGADPALGAAALATGGAFLALAVGVGSARGSFVRFDDWLRGPLVDRDLPTALTSFAVVGSTPVAIFLALLVGASALRCRTFAAAWAATIVGAFAADAAAKGVIDRHRPPGGSLAAVADSFPSGHVVQATLLAMAAPLALRIAIGRRWPSHVAGGVLGAVAVVTGIERVQAGTHWPTDVLGGLLLGLAAGFTLRWSLAHRTWHAGCHGCPWGPTLPPHRPGRPLLPVTRRQADGLRRVAFVWLALALAVLALVALRWGLPVDPEGDAALSQFERPLQLAVLAIAATGGAVAVRWGAAGATLLAVAALGLGLVGAVEHPTWIVLGVTASVALPAALLWLAWQHVQSLRTVTALAVVAASLLAAEATVATRVYDHFFGPAHPASTTAAVTVDRVTWAWTGDLRSDGLTVVAQLYRPDPDAAVSLAVRDEAGRVRTAATAAPDPDGVVRLRAAGLAPGTRYEWAILVDGRPDAGRGHGSFTTAPSGAASFTIAASSCARTGSNGVVFDAIREADPLVMVVTGDLHYGNLASTDSGAFLNAYRRVLTSPAQAALYREVPVDYVWDDHDYGPNDADATSPGRAAARAAYRQVVPHPPLASDGPIHHATTIGRVRVVVTDTRSERTEGSMLGAEQLAWLLGELRAADRWGLVVWVNPDPWIAPARAGRDDWGGYARERQVIADSITEARVDNLVMVSGDAHMVAIDDGTNSDFSTSGGGGFPVLHAGALDRPGNVKGGPYSEGAFPGAGQFALLHVEDDGERVAVQLEGHDWTGEVLASYRFVAG